MLKINRGKNIIIGGQRRHCPTLNFNNPKRSKIVYVAHGAISRRVAAAAKCESAAIDFWIFLKPFFGCFVRLSGPLSHAAYRKVHKRGPFN